jgi:hypothetical protein
MPVTRRERTSKSASWWGLPGMSRSWGGGVSRAYSIRMRGEVLSFTEAIRNSLALWMLRHVCGTRRARPRAREPVTPPDLRLRS